jgi:hypothetical protein
MNTFNIDPILDSLPTKPHSRLTDKYMFLDTRKVVDDMRDLGYEATGFRRAKGRTVNAQYGLHEVEFMRPQDLARDGSFSHEAPRILFMNSYDGSRKARFAAGIIRFACLNGMITGDLLANLTFLHMGEYEEELMKQMKEIAEETPKVFSKIDAYRDIKLDDEIYLDMADQALQLRYPKEEDRPIVDPAALIMPRRPEDHQADLYTTFNVLQENIIRGGVPGTLPDGRSRIMQPVKNIERSNTLNRQLWGLLETTAELA